MLSLFTCHHALDNEAWSHGTIGPTQWLSSKSRYQKLKVWKFYYLKLVRSLNVGQDTIINQSFLPAHTSRDDWYWLQEHKILKIMQSLKFTWSERQVNYGYFNFCSPSPYAIRDSPLHILTENSVTQPHATTTASTVPPAMQSNFFLALYLKNHCESSYNRTTTVQKRNRKQKDETGALACQQSRQTDKDGCAL